jgi:hypothetical protein
VTVLAVGETMVMVTPEVAAPLETAARFRLERPVTSSAPRDLV